MATTEVATGTLVPPERWPEQVFSRTIGGQPVRIAVPHKLLNPDDMDVGYAYSPLCVRSAGPDYEQVIARGRAKAQFEPISLDVDARLRPLARTLETLAPFATDKFWRVEIGRGETFEQWSIQAGGQLKGKGWVATFSPHSDGKGRSSILANLTWGGVTIGKELVVGTRKPDLKAWAKRALAAAKRARKLQGDLAKLGVLEDRDD